MASREFNTPYREPWNGPIHHMLKAVDQHVLQYLNTGDIWHLQQADILRKYVLDLKVYIHRQEGKLE